MGKMAERCRNRANNRFGFRRFLIRRSQFDPTQKGGNAPVADRRFCKGGVSQSCRARHDKFCNCGIYERGRDLVLFSLSRNKRLYNQFLHEYQKLTGVRVSRKHIRELALIEFLWAKRWYIGDVFAPMGANIVARNVGQVLMYFYHLPEITKPLVRVFMKFHARMVRK